EVEEEDEVGVREGGDGRVVRDDEAVDPPAAARLDRVEREGLAGAADRRGRVLEAPAGGAALDQEPALGEPLPEEAIVVGDPRPRMPPRTAPPHTLTDPFRPPCPS